MVKTVTRKRNYDETIIKAAHKVWQVMQSEAKKRGMALHREGHLGDGRVIVATVGGFIKALNKERNWGLAEAQIELVRRYLKASGNVVVMEKMEQYRFRIFIREEWSNAALLTQPIEEKKTNGSADPRGERLTPEEAGETKEPAPVSYKCATCGKAFDTKQKLGGHVSTSHKKNKKTSLSRVKSETKKKANTRVTRKKLDPIKAGTMEAQTIGEQQAAVMQLLDAKGGAIRSPSGLVAGMIVEASERISEGGVSSSLSALDERGWIEREINARRTYSVTLTPAGWEAVRNLNFYRQARYPIQEHLAEVGVVEGKDATGVLVNRLGISRERVRNALLLMRKEGLIEVSPLAKGQTPRRFVWLGEPKQRPIIMQGEAPNETDPTPPTHAETVEKVKGEKGVKFVEELPPIKRPRRDKTESAPATGLRKWSDLSDDELLLEVGTRIKAAASAEEIEELKERLDLIESLVNEAIEGKMSPLKALAEIQEAVSL